MAKNPFKKQSALDAALQIGIGGAANVAVDYLKSNIDALATVDEKWINAGKFVLGAVGSSMVSDRMVKAAMDGIAVVGVSDLVKSLMDGTTPAEGASGVPAGTIGRIGRRYVPGHRRAAASVIRGVNGVSQFVG